MPTPTVLMPVLGTALMLEASRRSPRVAVTPSWPLTPWMTKVP